MLLSELGTSGNSVADMTERRSCVRRAAGFLDERATKTTTNCGRETENFRPEKKLSENVRTVRTKGGRHVSTGG